MNRTLDIGPTRLVVSELPGGSNERILSVETPRFRHDLQFLAHYEPVLTVAEELLVVWAGTRLYCLSTSFGSICSRTFETDIVAVIPYGRRLVVVSELAAVIVGAECAVAESLFTHDEIIVKARREGRQVILSDLQGRVFQVELSTE